MDIKLKNITVRELTNYYHVNKYEDVGYDGKLVIRPDYQREFIYKDKQRDAVISTITKGLPLKAMYWAVLGDGNYEVIDGQQRTISVCQYVKNEFAYMSRYFKDLDCEEQYKILNYKLMVYLCNGTDSEKLEWFKTINIADEQLNDQEVRNVVYAGFWLSHAKSYFCKSGGPAYQIGGKYLNGSAIRQDYLEIALKWISKGNIEEYMSNHQHDKSALALQKYFQSVITWVSSTFTNYRKYMKGIEWGFLYNKYYDETYDTNKIEEEIAKLMLDDHVVRKSGIYPYILTRDERFLFIRDEQTNPCIERISHVQRDERTESRDFPFGS
ncbi:DUF262 domain-containing protein [Candidatus Saccharibacteria bacterium]|nr:DUF262 domain-containing protein [Candidatus Saccharibacteria bacterium]